MRRAAGACLLAVLLSSGALLWATAGSEPGAPSLRELGPLPEPTASCPEDGPHAEHAARVALQTARPRMQRYAFAPGDGLDALARLAEAIECARLSGDAAIADEAAAERARVRERIERDVREHALRYGLLRQHDRVREAEDDVVFLTELGWPDRGELADQLRRDRLLLEDDAAEPRP